MKRVVEMIDELKQDISFELIEQSGWELRNAYQTILQRLEDIRAVAEGACGPDSCSRCDDLSVFVASKCGGCGCGACQANRFREERGNK